MSDLIRDEVIYSSIIAGGAHGLNPRYFDSFIATTYKHKAEFDRIPRKLTEGNTLQSLSDSHSANRRYQYASDVVGDDWTDPRALCDSGPENAGCSPRPSTAHSDPEQRTLQIYMCVYI